MNASSAVSLAPTDPDSLRVRHLLAALSATNDAILRANSAQELYQQVCDAAVHGGRFSSAAVLLPDAEGLSLRSVAVSGPDRNLGGTRISARAESRFGRGLIGSTFRNRASTVSHDLLTDPDMLPWRPQIQTSGVRSGAGVPLMSDGRCLGVLLLYSRELGAFDAETVGLLQRMADNIIFCLRNLEREAQRLSHAEELLRFRTAMDTTGDAIYLIDPVELRYVDCNQTACRQTGYTRAELLSMHTWQVVTDTAEELTRLYRLVIDSGEAGLVSITTSRPKDARERIVEVHRRGLRSGEGWLIVSIARDVTERHRQERLLAMEHAVTRNLAQSGSTREVLTAVLRDICQGARWHSAGYFARRDAAGTTLLIAGWMGDAGASEVTMERAELLSRPIAPGSALSEVILGGQPIWTANVRDPSAGRVAQAIWYRNGPWTGDLARLGVPVFAEGKAIGVMAFTSEQIREPDERLLQSLRVIGDQIGQFLQRKGTERVLRESEARFRALTELSSDWYWEQDAEHRFTRIGGGGGGDGGIVRGKAGDLAMFGGHATWELPGLVDESADFVRHRAVLAAREEFRDFTFAIHDGQGRLRWLSLSGSPLYGPKEVFIGYRGVSRDVTERKRALDRIEHLATHDVLTGLPNRAMFTEVLGRTLEGARRQDDRLALLFIDLDRFKLINDTLGHDAGDLLLKEMAQRMKGCLRTSDLVARFGGDEFVVLVRQVNDRNEATAVARKILDAATQAITIQGQECRVSASVGICLYPADGSDEQTLMKAADTAMYAAKQEGRNNFQFYSRERTQQSLARLKLESSLRRAVENHEFFLHYQPKVEMSTGTIVGAEALVRWRTPDMRLISPADFIPLAEETGLILQIGVWVLREACAQNMVWRRQGLPPIGMAVNLSPRQFADEQLLGHLERALRESGMDADALELEITEGMMVQEPQRAVELLQAIKKTGVRLAIDDFGTGYSSLGQLKRFPIDALKIDRSFVRELGQDSDDMALTSAIIAMAKSLRLRVVAEGVETPQQEAFLKAHGCDQMQGFLFSRPVPPEEFVRIWRQSLEPRDAVRTAVV